MPGLALSRAGVRVFESDTPDGECLDELVWERLAALPDPRCLEGRLYPLPCLVAAAVCAMMGPARGRAVGRAPSMKVRAYRARRQAAQQKALARNRIRGVAVDGKTSRGARRPDGTRVHLLGVLEHCGRLLDHLEVDVKHNETTHFTELDLTGTAVTFDALDTVRANLDWLVTAKHAHYVAVVKNQPLLYARVKALRWKRIPTGSASRKTGLVAGRPAPAKLSPSPSPVGWASRTPPKPSGSPAPAARQARPST